MRNSTQKSDLVIIGAGPAGLSAAQIAATNGLSVMIIDEFPIAGGRMNGQFHEEPGQGWWIGKEIAERLITENTKAGVIFQCGTAVHDIVNNGIEWLVHLSSGQVRGTYLLLATGAAEVPAPLPGWTLPGVMSIGAAQVMTNVHYVKPGDRGLIIGVNTLSMAIARELIASGVEITNIVLPPLGPFSRETANPLSVFQTLTRLSHMAPSLFMRLGGKLTNALNISKAAIHFFPKKGINMWGVPLQIRTAATCINGSKQVESVTVVDVTTTGEVVPGSERDIAVDFVAIAGGLYPLAELAHVAGCPFVHIPSLGGHIPVHNERLQTPVHRLYVAGNITGIEGAQVAMAQGRLAGTSVCHEIGLFGKSGEEKLAAAMQSVRDTRESALIQFHPDIAQARESLYRHSSLTAVDQPAHTLSS